MGTDTDNPHRERMEDIKEEAHEIRVRSEKEKDRLRDAPSPHDPCPAHAKLMDALFERVSDTRMLAKGVESLAGFCGNGLGDRVASITASVTVAAVREELTKHATKAPAYSLFGKIISRALHDKVIAGLLMSILGASLLNLKGCVGEKYDNIVAARKLAQQTENQIAQERDERRAQWRATQSNQVEILTQLQKEIAAIRNNR